MGWDRGRYYSRSKKISGRVVREYVWTGVVAALAAQFDDAKRMEREAELNAERQLVADLDALDAIVAIPTDAADLAVRAELLAAGFHRPKRGTWRKRRAK